VELAKDIMVVALRFLLIPLQFLVIPLPITSDEVALN
jgi:hypothetical protein